MKRSALCAINSTPPPPSSLIRNSGWSTKWGHRKFLEIRSSELTQRVHQISRIAGAAFGFLLRHRPDLVAFLDEELHRLLHGHLSGVHLYPNDEARVPQERVLQLPQPQLQIALAVAFVQHHLLRVVRPTLRVGATAKQLADLGRGARDPYKLRVVPWISLVHRRADDGPPVEALQVLLGLLRVPRLLGKRDVEECLLGDLLEWPGRIHRRGGQRPHEGRRLLHNRRHLGRNRHDPVLLDELAQPAQHIAKTLHQLPRRRMVQQRFVQNLLRGPGFVYLRGHPRELLLVAAQIFPADLEQPVHRDIHHLVVEQLLAVGLGADPELALRARQQVRLQKCPIAVECVDHGTINLLEFPEQRAVAHPLERRGHVVLEEADDPRHLFQCNFSVNPRRVLEVLARRLKQPRNQLFARDHGFQPHRRRRETAAHDHEHGVRDARGVEIRVLLPRPNHFQRQQLPANLRQHQFPVGRRDQRKSARIEACHFLFELVERRRLRLDIGARPGRQQRIVLMEPRLRTLHGIVSEHHFVKYAVRQLVELAVTLLSEPHPGQHKNRHNSRHLHGVDYSEASRRDLLQPQIPATSRCFYRLYGQEVRAMSYAVDRLKLAEAVLALIEQKRAETGDDSLGAAIERVVLDTQFQELEAEILENPGAIEPWLIRRRPGD